MHNAPVTFEIQKNTDSQIILKIKIHPAHTVPGKTMPAMFLAIPLTSLELQYLETVIDTIMYKERRGGAA